MADGDEMGGFAEDPFGRISSPSGPPDPELARQAQIIRARQEAHGKVLGRLVDFYRTFNKKPRKALLKEMEGIYQALCDLGLTIGISRLSFPRLADC